MKIVSYTTMDEINMDDKIITNKEEFFNNLVGRKWSDVYWNLHYSKDVKEEWRDKNIKPIVSFKHGRLDTILSTDGDTFEYGVTDLIQCNDLYLYREDDRFEDQYLLYTVRSQTIEDMLNRYNKYLSLTVELAELPKWLIDTTNHIDVLIKLDAFMYKLYSAYHNKEYKPAKCTHNYVADIIGHYKNIW
ncbi:MAG: hypothetical protein ACYC27_20605 [Armatimonadota bacterium]